MSKLLKVRGSWCRHRTPFDASQYPVCKVGIDYHKFPKPHNQMPCLGETEAARAGCPQYSGYTDEELADREKDLDERFDRIALIRSAIIAQIKATSVRGGHIPCPACKTGTVGYSQASNGHVHARCSTDKCAAWME